MYRYERRNKSGMEKRQDFFNFRSGCLLSLRGVQGAERELAVVAFLYMIAQGADDGKQMLLFFSVQMLKVSGYKKRILIDSSFVCTVLLYRLDETQKRL